MMWLEDAKGYDCVFIAKEKLKHIVSKEAFNIDGLGKKVIEQFWDLKLIKEPSDIFNLDYLKIEKLEGWGELSIDNLKKAVLKSKTIGLDKFIFSIGIRHIGQENAKILAGFFVSIEEFKKLFDQLTRKKNFKKFNRIRWNRGYSNSINRQFFSNKTNIRITKELINRLIIEHYTIQNNDGKFSNKKIMFTGGFKDMSRSEAKTVAEQNGGKVLGSVSAKLDFLVVGDAKPTKRKIDQAKELKVKIITEAEWNKILNS